MEIREATLDDMNALMPLAHKAHQQSVFKGVEMNEAVMQRSFVVAIHYDSGYAKVVEDEGRICGGLVGLIAENHFGIVCAQDLFCYSAGMTDRLIIDFTQWAQEQGAQFVQITDLSHGARYQKLCFRLGFEHGGNEFIKVM